jgi:hypothetical protein
MFEEFPKIARLSRECVITEKIDGTNGQVFIQQRCSCSQHPGATCSSCPNPRLLIAERDGLLMYAGSRTQFITPERDNHGFARWVQEHAYDLFALGEGRHFGEWWGSGIQRGYGLPKGEKRFSMFNVARWDDLRDREKFPQDRPTCCHVVPVLYQGAFFTDAADTVLDKLSRDGSRAAPGFMKPEGIVVWHEAARQMFKKTLERDAEPKSKQLVTT